jgi:hypothetical protein
MKNVIICFLVLFSGLSIASENIRHLKPGEKSPLASIDQVAWIAGHWKGEAFGGITEEIWSPPQAGSMMASFRLINKGVVSFYEIEIIREINGSLVLELKHFNNDLKGWETKDEVVSFPLVKITKDTVYFDGMTFKNISKNEMQVFVAIEDNGKNSEVLFSYKK